MSDEVLAYLCAAAALLALTAYALLGGADFGGGVWDLFATGPRKGRQRHAVAHAMGPVWEANHVWLIFVLVLLFTCFPRGYAALCVGLFVPLHLILLGIMLRGAAFVFRNYDAKKPIQAKGRWRVNLASARWWGLIFGVASMVSPVLLGASFGAVTAGALRVDAGGNVLADSQWTAPWLSPYSIGCGFLALSTCSYLAAVYLVVETRGDLREDFRRRAIFAGTATAVAALVVMRLAAKAAPWFVHNLWSWPAEPVVLAGLVLFAGSAVAVFGRFYRLSCFCAAAQVVAVLVGWGIAHRDYLIYPDVPLVGAAAPRATLVFVLVASCAGMALLLPSLWMLFHIFKREHMAKPMAAPPVV